VLPTGISFFQKTFPLKKLKRNYLTILNQRKNPKQVPSERYLTKKSRDTKPATSKRRHRNSIMIHKLVNVPRTRAKRIPTSSAQMTRMHWIVQYKPSEYSKRLDKYRYRMQMKLHCHYKTLGVEGQLKSILTQQNTGISKLYAKYLPMSP